MEAALRNILIAVGKTASFSLLFALAGCGTVVLGPAGDIAVQERDLIAIATALMLIIVVPVLALILFFAWKYRASNTAAAYEPDWNHSTRLEVLIWTAPLAIIICLGTVTWISTHKLDPYRPLGMIKSGTSANVAQRPLRVEVVALDWKWLFFYPDYGVATVNELAAPLDTPIEFHITASSVMNSFFVPSLAGQVYAMPGMETKLHAVMNKPGVYDGFSANYSGAGFSQMRFKFYGLSAEEFNFWMAKVKTSQTKLDRNTYAALVLPSEGDAPRLFATADPELYNAILNRCATPGKLCADEIMQIDTSGGGGDASSQNFSRVTVDRPTDLSVEPTPLAQ